MNVNTDVFATGSAAPAVTTVPVARAWESEVDLLRRQLVRIAAITELVGQIESAENINTASQILADRLRPFLAVDKLLVGLCREGKIDCQLTAISGETFSARSPLAVAAQGVLQESIARGGFATWPPTAEGSPGGLLAHRQFAQGASVAAIISSPLRDATGQLRGAWLVTGSVDIIHSENLRSFLSAAEPAIASALRVVSRAQQGRVQLAFHEARRFLCQRRGRVALVATALCGCLLCIPVPYHAQCDCTVEPVTRRFVAAPFAGPLVESLVEPGDMVEAGQLLARMDGRELRMELSGIRADLHRATKERAGHLATLESGQAEVARFEVDRLQARTELLEHRERNVEIRSPIAGVVVSGDHEDAEGMPLDIGQTMFEIAPLDEMVVEVALVEDDFAYIRAGMAVTIRLDAFPLRRFDASIQKVHPRAELRDDENVFIAEVCLEGSGRGLRPGMRGTSWVKADRYPLGWNLFRRPLTRLLAWLGW